MMAFFRFLSAATMSDGLDKAKRKPMQMMTLKASEHALRYIFEQGTLIFQL